MVSKFQKNEEKIKTELQELKAELKNIKTKIEELEKKEQKQGDRWKPELDSQYCCIGSMAFASLEQAQACIDR